MRSKKDKTMLFITIGSILIIVYLIGYAFYQRNVVADKYSNAIELYNEGNYEDALEIFDVLHNYKQANNYIGKIEVEMMYSDAVKKFDAGEYDIAKQIFMEIENYEDSRLYLAQIDIKSIEESKKIVYENALIEYELGNYLKALELFETVLDYGNSKQMVEECKAQILRRNLCNIISAGVRTSIAIESDGDVMAVGDNTERQCEVAQWRDVISVDTYGCFTVGLTKDGDVELAGVYDGKDVDISNWNNIIDVAAGERFVIGLKSDGTVVSDGHNADGQLNVESWEEVIAIDAGWSVSVALTKDGELLFAGEDNGQKEEFQKNKEQWKDVVNISTSGGGSSSRQRGTGHTVGLKADGTVVAVGDNSRGQCDVSSWSNIIKVTTGDWYTVGLTNDGKVVITGENVPRSKYIDYGVIETCDDIVDIAAGFGHTLCLHKDGTITAFGFDEDNKCTGTQSWKDIKVHDVVK